MLRECENALDVGSIDARVVELQLRERQLLLQLVALALVDGMVNRPLVDECLFEPFETCVGSVDVMPDGERAILIRGGLMYSDLVVAQDVLQPHR